MLCWSPKKTGTSIYAVPRDTPLRTHDRHTGKNALGDVRQQRSFYCRGPDHKINRRAKKLVAFLRIADKIDDMTWRHHLRAGDYSARFRNVVLDETLAQATDAIERNPGLDARESRRRVRGAISARYLIPEDEGSLDAAQGACPCPLSIPRLSGTVRKQLTERDWNLSGMTATPLVPADRRARGGRPDDRARGPDGFAAWRRKKERGFIVLACAGKPGTARPPGWATRPSPQRTVRAT